MSDDLLERAVELSRLGAERGDGGPFGAVVARDGHVLGEGWNRVLADADPTAHAEVVAIRAACRAQGTHVLEGATMFASSEPCPMCWAATGWARCSRIVYANTRREAAEIGFDDAVLYEQLALPPRDRAVPMHHAPRASAIAVFEDWYADPDRVLY